MQYFHCLNILTFCFSLWLFSAQAQPVPDTSKGTAPALRVVTLDWSLTETVISLGIIPVGVANIEGYQAFSGHAKIPPDTFELGLRLRPNLERLSSLKPDLILAANIHADILPRLRQIAPVYQSSIYDKRRTPLANAMIVTRDIARHLKVPEAGETLILALESALKSARETFKKHNLPPVYLASFLDPRHVRLFAKNSLFQDVLAQIHIENAWHGDTNEWGFSFIGIEKLHHPSNTFLFQLEPIPPGIQESLKRSTLWQHLPFVRQAQIATLPPVMADGMLPSAIRFTHLLTQALRTHVSQ